MANSITVGRRLIPSDHIAFVEPYDPDANPGFQTSRAFKARVVMLDPRESMLAEDTPQGFAEANGFRMLEIDGVALNPAIHYRVESFAPTPRFSPSKPYATRLLWRDIEGSDQSKLLLSDPDTVLTVALRGNVDAYAAQSRRPGRRKSLSGTAVALAPEQ